MKPNLSELKRALLKLPVKERQALVRRAQLRSVDGIQAQAGNNSDSAGLNDILCKLPVIDQAQNDPPSNNQRPRDCSAPDAMATRKAPPPGRAIPPSPINNFPREIEYEGGMPDHVTMEIFALRRRNAELSASLQGANDKLTVALEALFSLRRFLHLWIFDGQGETYDQVHGRIRRLESVIAHIENRVNGPCAPLEIPKRWTGNKDG